MEIDITLLKFPKSWNTETDNRLLKAAGTMNKGALAAIFDRYAPPLYNYALCLCHDPLAADEVVGEVFAGFLNQVAAGKGSAFSLRFQLFQAAHHSLVCRPQVPRREAADISRLFQLHGNGWLTGPDDSSLLKAILQSIVQDLTADQCHVIVLRFLEGFSLQETADILGKKVYNVGMIQNRAITKLHEILNGSA